MSSKVAERLREITADAAWLMPFFLPPLTRVTFVETESVPTLGVSEDGIIRVNPNFVTKLADNVQVGCVLHELLHLMARHLDRRGERKKGLFNIAADMTINEFLRSINVSLPQGVFYPPPGLEGLAAETIYDRLKDDPEWQKKGEAVERAMASGTLAPGQGCGSEPGEGNTTGEGGSSSSIDWVDVGAQAKYLADKNNGRGKGTFERLSSVLNPRPAGQKWSSVLRGTASRALSAHGKDQQTFSRRNRRSPPGFIFPGWKAVKARIAVMFDTSGSVSDAMLSRGLDQVFAMSKVADVRIFLVVHDDGVKWAGWVSANKRAEIASKFRNRGGTTFDEAYARVTLEKVTFDAAIHLTDGEVGYWPEKPSNCRKLVAAIYGSEIGGSRWSNPPNGTLIVPVEV